MFRIGWMTFLVLLFTGWSAFADVPKILRVSQLKTGTRAIGFSVFRGVEPRPFEVEIRGIESAGYFRLILARVSGGPMETPLEKIGAVSGMSGSPIFVGDCREIDECRRKAVEPESDVYLVGALSYAPGVFPEGGFNAGITPAEYMLGSRLSPYGEAGQFSLRPPNRVKVGGREFKHLMFLQGMDELGEVSRQIQGSLPVGACEESVKGELKPGSMVSVLLARGAWDIGASGTVTWIDGNLIYIFGHPFFGTGPVSYPFRHVAVTDTFQSPLNPHKRIGCHLPTRGAMAMDGMFEVAGFIGRDAQALPYRVELHVGQNLTILYEEIPESPVAPVIFEQLPLAWIRGSVGDLRYVSVWHQTRISVADQPEIFLEKLIPAQRTERPISAVFSELGAALRELRQSGFNARLEGIKVHVDLVNGIKVWTAKRFFFSEGMPEVAAGRTFHINVVLEEFSTKDLRQISVPVAIPQDFLSRLRPEISPTVTVLLQSANRFTSRAEPKATRSLRDLIGKINEEGNRKQNVLYVQQIMPRSEAEQKVDREKAKVSVRPDGSWTPLSEEDLNKLPRTNAQEVLLSLTPELNHFIDFNAAVTIRVVKGNGSAPSHNETTGQNAGKGFNLEFLKVWKIFR